MVDWAAMATYARGQQPVEEEEEKPKSGLDWDAMAAKAKGTPEEQLVDTEGPTPSIRHFYGGRFGYMPEQPREGSYFEEDDGIMAAFQNEMEAWGDAIETGWDDSITGMAIQKDVAHIDPDTEMRHAFLRELTSAVVDLPIELLAAVPGAVAGGGIGGVASSSAITSGLRQWLVDEYSQGNGEPEDLQARLFNVLRASAGGAAGGLIGGAAGGKVFGKLAPRYGSKIAALVSNPVELAAMSTTQSLIQSGRLPTLHDFKGAAISMLAGKSVNGVQNKFIGMQSDAKLKAKEHMEAKLQHIYVKTGQRPEQILKLAQSDPLLFNQLLDPRMQTPDSLRHLDPTDIMSKVDEGSRPPENIKEGAKRAKQDLHDAFIDDLGPIKRAYNKLMGSDDAWDKVEAHNNTYKLASLARGWAGKFEHMMEYGGWNARTGQADGTKGIMKLLREVENPESGTSLRDFARYMVSSRAHEKETQFFNQRRDFRSELRDLKREQGLHDPKSVDHYKIGKQIQKLNRQYEKLRSKRDTNQHTGMKQFDNRRVREEGQAKYARFEKDFQDFNKSLLKQMETAGILSKQDLERITRDNQSYVPFQRLMDNLVDMGGNGSGTPKKMDGSGRPIRNPFEAYIESIQKNLQAIEHNTVMQHLANLDTDGTILRKRPLDGEDKTINQVAKEQGIQPSEVSAFDLMKSADSGDKKVIYGFENGKRVAYEVDKDIARAFDNLTGRGYKLINTDNPVAHAMWKILKMPSDALRFGATTTPDFMVANFLRDVTSSFGFSKNGNRHLISFSRGAAQMLTKNTSESYKEMLRSGGEVMGQHRDGTRPHLNRDVYAELSKRPVKNLLSIEKLNQMKDRISDLTEGAARMGEYIAAKDNGKSRLEAAFQHRDISLDFARAGYVGRYINDIVTFHNAGVQSLSKLHRVMTTGSHADKAKIMGKLFVGVTLPSILLNALFGDDEMVQQVPQWERDLYWIIPAGDYLIRLPKPHEVGVVFGSAVERSMDQMRNDDPRAWEGFKDSLASKMIPGGFGGIGDFASSVTALKPFIEAATNHNFFRDTPLVPGYLENIAPEFQYKHNTSEIARLLGDVFGKINQDMNPIAVDNFIQAWSGGVGRYVTDTLDALLKGNDVKPKGDDAWQELPVIKSFIARNPATTGRARAIEAFRKRHEKALREANTVSFLKNNFMFNDMRDRLSKNLWFKNDAVYNRIRDIQKLIYQVSNLPSGFQDMTDEELAHLKAESIEKMYTMMMLVAESGLQTYDNIDKRLEEQ